jgi:hypothetical protein
MAIRALDFLVGSLEVVPGEVMGESVPSTVGTPVDDHFPFALVVRVAFLAIALEFFS